MLRFMVLSYWVDKESKEHVSSIAPVNEGVSKAGNSFGITDSQSTRIIAGRYPLGSFVEFAPVPVVSPGFTQPVVTPASAPKTATPKTTRSMQE